MEMDSRGKITLSSFVRILKRNEWWTSGKGLVPKGLIKCRKFDRSLCFPTVFCCQNLTFHRWLQGDVHVTQIPIAALYHQLRSWWASAAQGPFLIRHNAALLKNQCPVQYREGGEALLAETPLPTAAGRSITQTFRVSHADVTCSRKKKNQLLRGTSISYVALNMLWQQMSAYPSCMYI